MIKLMCVVLAIGASLACGKGKEAGSPAEQKLVVVESGAGTGPRAGQVRLVLAVPGNSVKSVKVNGVAGQPGTLGDFWAPLPEAMRKPGKHEIQIDAVLYPKGKDAALRASTAHVLEVRPEIPMFTIRAIRGGGEGATTVSCFGCEEGHTFASVGADGTVQFDVTTPAGNVIDWSGEKTTSTGAARRVSLRLADRFGDAPTSELPELGFALPLLVTNPDGGTNGSTRLAGDGVASVVFAPLRKGRPVTFGAGEVAGPRRSLLVVPNGELKVAVFGTAAKVRDVDLVATVLVTEASRISCGAYAKGGKAGGKTEGFLIIALDLSVEVHDRRTGMKLGERTFRAPRAACPSAIVAGASAQFSTGDKTAALAFARSFLKP